jgi:hypothetical protein
MRIPIRNWDLVWLAGAVAAFAAAVMLAGPLDMVPRAVTEAGCR